MQAAFLTESKNFKLKNVKKPVPGKNDIIVEIRACGICGSDIRRWQEGPAGKPYISGHEISGVVSVAGSSVKGFTVGEKVAVAPDVHCGKCYYCRHGLFNLCNDLKLIGINPEYPGGFAENILLTEEILINGIVNKMPEGISFDHAALSEPCSSVLAAHDRIGTGINHTVLVMGAGPIGCIHIIIAHLRGARVIVSEPNIARRNLSKLFKPELTLDPFKDDLPDAIMQITNGRGVDSVICANPVSKTQTQAVELVRKRGKVVLFGGLKKTDPNTLFNSNKIHYDEIEVIGSFSYNPTYHSLALETLSSGLIPGEKLISKRFFLNDINLAFSTAATAEVLKILIYPGKKET